MHVLLRREGWTVNAKRVERLDREENLTVRTKKRRKIASVGRTPQGAAQRLNEQWSMDFVHDRTQEGRRLRVLTVVDNFSRQCLALEADRSLSGERVAATLEEVARRRGNPQRIRVDNGTEFYSKAQDAWAYRRGVQVAFIRPGKPTASIVGTTDPDGICGRALGALAAYDALRTERARNNPEATRRGKLESLVSSVGGNVNPGQDSPKLLSS